MSRREDKLIQYLAEAQAMELALVTTLRAHILMTPRGAYRLLLERHLEETRAQARRIGERLSELGASRSLVASSLLTLQTVAGQAISLSKGPVDALRGRSGEEKLLKNAKDECATEALEIATYIGLETLARSLDDVATADLAADHRAQEERMLARLHEQLPRLTEAVVAAELGGERAYDPAKTGAADAARGAADAARDATE
ncbi:MAG: ferritin-like domain-containing protein, partial [Actinomycetota bacterium]|nr:ferritin-like domain-containing protein [Actinomycetota bacterium]